jgi:hypothetical protein
MKKRIPILLFALCVCAAGFAQVPLSPMRLLPSDLDSFYVLKLLQSDVYRTYTRKEMSDIKAKCLKHNTAVLDSVRAMQERGLKFDSTGLPIRALDALSDLYAYSAPFDMVIGKDADVKTIITQHVLGLAYEYPYLFKTSAKEPYLSYDVSRKLQGIWIYPVLNDNSSMSLTIIARMTTVRAVYVPKADEQKVVNRHTENALLRGEMAQGKKPRPKEPRGIMLGSGGAGAGNGGGRPTAEVQISGDLGFRSVKHKPDLTVTDAFGKAAIKVCVNKEGEVISVEWDASKSTIKDPDIRKKCLQMAKKFMFRPSDQTSDCGVIMLRYQ